MLAFHSQIAGRDGRASRKAVFFTRRNQELASKLVSSFQWHRRWDVDVENTTLACTPLVFHFDVLLRIEIVRVWRHLLVGVPFKNWIKKKGGRGWKYAALGGRKESNVTSVWFFFYVEFVLFVHSSLKASDARDCDEV